MALLLFRRLSRSTKWLLIVILTISIALALFISPAPHSPAQAISRWRGYFLARSFAAHVKAIKPTDIVTEEDKVYHTSRDPEVNESNRAMYSSLIRRAIPSARPVGGDWGFPHCFEWNFRNCMVDYLGDDIASNGSATIDGRRYSYLLFFSGELFLFSHDDEMEIKFSLVEDVPLRRQ